LLVEFFSRVSGGLGQGKLQIHVPEEVARHLDVTKGDQVVWVVEDQKVEIRKKESK